MQAIWFFIANLVSLIGSSISMVAIPWFVLQVSGDIAITSFIMSVRILPTIISLFIGTHLFENYTNRWICIISDLFSGTLIISIPLLFHYDYLTLPLLLAIICAEGAVEQINRTSLSAMMPEVINKNNYSFERFNGIIGSLHNIGDLLGPALAGVIISIIGNSAAFIIDGITFFVSALIFKIFLTNLNRKFKSKSEEETTSLRKIKKGIIFIFNHPHIKYAAVLSITVNFLIMPLLTLVLPLMAQTKLENTIDLGFLFSTFGTGTLIASLAFTLYGSKMKKKRMMVGCSVLLFFSLVLGGLIKLKLGLYFIIFFIGLSVGFLGPLDNTILQQYAPEEKRGLIFLIYTSLRFLSIPLSYILFGFTLKLFPIFITFFFMAAIVFFQLIYIIPAKIDYEG